MAEDFLRNQELEDKNAVKDASANLRKLIRSRPYVRKSNMVTDHSINFCWESMLRFNGYDLYVTILRRSYIPPFADMYQDVIICSKFMLEEDFNDKRKPETEQAKDKVMQRTYKHLKDCH